jgi:photosystem II stability/assembly factor-like uncharacterized protein/DNA-binding CsgD family transcriptional regulator
MTSGQHYQSKTRDVLTTRQQEILALIAQGYTNAQVAEHLGITFAGAKWHVSEIIAKLGVESRDEAVQVWHAERSFRQRLTRGLHALLGPVLVHKFATIAIAAAAVAAVGVGTFVALHRSSGSTTELSSTTELPHSPTFGQVIGPPTPFGKMQMFDANSGWGSIGSHAYLVYSYYVVRSDDGGRTWTDASPDLGDKTAIQAVFFLDGRRAWALIDDNTSVTQTANARVVWTSDGGKTWAEGNPLGKISPLGTGTPSLLSLQQVLFIDPQHGWVFENASTIYRTTNGGASWQKVSITGGTNTRPATHALPASCLTSLTFIDTTRGFAAGSCDPAESGPPLFFRTDDAGKSWQRQALPSPAQPVRCPCSVGPPSFPTPNDGFVVLLALAPDSNSLKNGSIRTVYRTQDGGSSWQFTGEPSDTTAYGSAAKFVDPMNGWLVDGLDTGIVTFRTEDGAQTWQQLPGRQYVPFNFISPTDVWTLDPAAVVSNRNPVMHTLDGGLTWQPVVPGSP